MGMLGVVEYHDLLFSLFQTCHPLCKVTGFGSLKHDEQCCEAFETYTPAAGAMTAVCPTFESCSLTNRLFVPWHAVPFYIVSSSILAIPITNSPHMHTSVTSIRWHVEGTVETQLDNLTQTHGAGASGTYHKMVLPVLFHLDLVP